MTRPTLTYKTSDGMEFTNAEAANRHANMLVHVETFMDRQGVGQSRRKKLRTMLLEWAVKVQTTDFDVVPQGDES